MKQRNIRYIIGLMTIALLGVMGMQYFFIRQSYVQKSLLFDESVKAAINTVASKAEKLEVMEYSEIVQQMNKERFQREKNLERQVRLQEEMEDIRHTLTVKQQEYRDQEDHVLRMYPQAVLINNEFYETYINKPENNHLVTVDFGVQHSGMAGDFYQENFIEIKTRKTVPLEKAKDDSVRFLLVMDINPLTKQALNDIVALPPRTDLVLERQLRMMEQSLKLVQARTLMDTIAIFGGKSTQVVEDFAISMELAKKPLDQRINVDFIKQELLEELANREIDAPFQLEIRDEKKILFQFANMRNAAKTDLAIYSTPLFKEDLEGSNGQLLISFPNKQAAIMGNMEFILIVSIGLLLVLIGSFTYTILTLLKQKKISEMKTDFINNMTHEFKTPVATIMIASESLKDPEIAMDTARASRLAHIIYDENVRLGNHIERVLNIARIEKENLTWEAQPIHVNELLHAVLDSMVLQFQKNEVELTTELNAEKDLILADEFHLTNIMFNLLDNAIKYGQQDPKIFIRTRNTNKEIHIQVEDNGIGMNKEQLNKIFAQFYRIPTGNRHDVKGFGLGLSYVDDIVKRMKGKVSVKSERGKGTVFEVSLPLR